ncbi:MAG: hypothetical protein ACFCD0_27445 [Gemmataceae bacterium]
MPQTTLRICILLWLAVVGVGRPSISVGAQYNRIARRVPQVSQRPRRYIPPPLYLRVDGLEGMRVTFYRGVGKPAELVSPFRIAIRPGYVYRIKISNIAGFPGLEVHPTLDVRGSLRPDSKIKPSDYPATLRFTKEDFARIRAGSYVKKVLALERPSMAVAETSIPEAPLTFRVGVGEDPLKVAEQRAVPFLIMRMGQRTRTEKELEDAGLAGTILLPGETTLPYPKVPPYIPWACPELYDPLGNPDPRFPDLCVADGGDVGVKATVDPDGRLNGLDASDTLVRYQNSLGEYKVAASNRVCLCVPRYLVYFNDAAVSGHVIYSGVSGIDFAKTVLANQSKVPPLVHHKLIPLQAFQTRLSASEAVSLVTLRIEGQYKGVDLLAQIEGVKGVAAASLPPAPKRLPDRPLLVDKWPDKKAAQIGDVIMFTIRYKNVGGQPIKKIVIHDSLVARFEYIPGSSKSDRPVLFTTQPNEQRSTLLRWQLTEDLPPGEFGIIQFKARIR